MYQVKGYFRSIRSPTVSVDYIRYLYKTLLVLSKVHLIRGQPAPADEYLHMIGTLPLEYQSPSEHFEYLILDIYLRVLKGERISSLLDFLNGLEPTEESIYQAASVGLYYLIRCYVELSGGEVLQALHSSRNSLSSFEKSENPLFIYNAMVLRGWCHLFSCKLDDSMQIASDSSLYATISQGIPLLLHKWGVELLIINKILKNDYQSAQVDWEKLQTLTRTSSNYSYSPTSCALYAMMCVMQGQYMEAIPFTRNSCLKLSQKQYTSPLTVIFLFYAGYSALRILEYCKTEMVSSYRTLLEVGYERLGLTYLRGIIVSASPSPNNSPRKKFNDRDYRSISDQLVPCINMVIKRLESMPPSILISQGLNFILNFMKRRIMTPSKNLSNYYSNHGKYFLDGKFAFGLHYFKYEAALYFASKDTKQAHTEALQLYQAAKNLITSSLTLDPTSGVSGVSQLTDVQDFLPLDDENLSVVESPIKKSRKETMKFLAKINESASEFKEDKGLTIITNLECDDSLPFPQSELENSSSTGKNQKKYLPENEESKLDEGLVLTNFD